VSSFIGRAFQSESPEDASPKRRPAAEAGAGRLELVHEAPERRAVVEVAPDDVERDAEERTDAGLSARARDPLLDADHGREQPAHALHVPDPIELAHG
jgi:hypothetical protein